MQYSISHVTLIHFVVLCNLQRSNRQAVVLGNKFAGTELSGLFSKWRIGKKLRFYQLCKRVCWYFFSFSSSLIMKLWSSPNKVCSCLPFFFQLRPWHGLKFEPFFCSFSQNSFISCGSFLFRLFFRLFFALGHLKSDPEALKYIQELTGYSIEELSKHLNVYYVLSA